MSESVVTIHDKRPTSVEYAGRILRHTLTLRCLRELMRLFLYYVNNHVIGLSRAHIGKGVRIWPTALFRDADRIYIGDNTSINHNNILWAGRRSAVIRIGKDVMLGPGVQVIAYNHCMVDGIPLREYFTERDIIIEDNVWLGAGVIVLAGATIGHGTVVGAGSVVVNDLPAHSVCAGVPARVMKVYQPGPIS